MLPLSVSYVEYTEYHAHLIAISCMGASVPFHSSFYTKLQSQLSDIDSRLYFPKCADLDH